jgi:RNA polymerase sigma factor (sigma-70 family)
VARTTPEELDAWVLATAARATAYARSLLRNVHQAEDVVQDCYCRLLQKQDVYDLPRDGLKLLLTSISNACINLKTRRRNLVQLQPNTERDEAALPEPADPRADQPAEIAIGHELEVALAEALGKLPQMQRAAVQLKSLGYSQQQIGEILEISSSNAGVLIHRARHSLSEMLASYTAREGEK